MSESVIADFVGKFNAEAFGRAEPVPGRVLLSQKRLVLAAREDRKLTIPLTEIFDVAVGHVPPDLGDFFDSTVTIAFEHEGSRQIAVVEAGAEKIEKFELVLFKSLLNGTETTLKERARVGGRVTDAEFSTASLYIEPGAVEFRSGDDVFEIPLETVTEFDRTTREIGGMDRPVLVVRHMQDGTAVTTLAAIASPRKMSILGRYLRLEYRELLAEIEDVELTTDKKELLVAVYSTGDVDGVPLAKVVSGDAAEVTMLVEELAEDGLLQDGDDGTKLTPKGEIVASNHVDDVNA